MFADFGKLSRAEKRRKKAAKRAAKLQKQAAKRAAKQQRKVAKQAKKATRKASARGVLVSAMAKPRRTGKAVPTGQYAAASSQVVNNLNSARASLDAAKQAMKDAQGRKFISYLSGLTAKMASKVQRVGVGK